MLASSGVISLSIIDGGNFDDTNGTDKYQLTDIGYKLLKFGLNENIEFVPQKKYSNSIIELARYRWYY